MAPDIEIKTILVSSRLRKKEKKTKKNVDVFAENCKAAAAEAAEAGGKENLFRHYARGFHVT